MTNLEIILPATSEEPLADILRAITEAIVKQDNDKWVGGFFGGSYGYGAPWDSDVFQMHPFCWCDADDCPWCGYQVDDRPTPQALAHGALPDEPDQSAPNFWHKPSGLRVWWYKYIGRGMETHALPFDLTPIFRDCISDIAAQGGEAR